MSFKRVVDPRFYNASQTKALTIVRGETFQPAQPNGIAESEDFVQKQTQGRLPRKSNPPNKDPAPNRNPLLFITNPVIDQVGFINGENAAAFFGHKNLSATKLNISSHDYKDKKEAESAINPSADGRTVNNKIDQINLAVNDDLIGRNKQATSNFQFDNLREAGYVGQFNVNKDYASGKQPARERKTLERLRLYQYVKTFGWKKDLDHSTEVEMLEYIYNITNGNLELPPEVKAKYPNGVLPGIGGTIDIPLSIENQVTDDRKLTEDSTLIVENGRAHRESARGVRNDDPTPTIYELPKILPPKLPKHPPRDFVSIKAAMITELSQEFELAAQKEGNDLDTDRVFNDLERIARDFSPSQKNLSNQQYTKELAKHMFSKFTEEVYVDDIDYITDNTILEAFENISKKIGINLPPIAADMGLIYEDENDAAIALNDFNEELENKYNVPATISPMSDAEKYNLPLNNKIPPSDDLKNAIAIRRGKIAPETEDDTFGEGIHRKQRGNQNWNSLGKVEINKTDLQKNMLNIRRISGKRISGFQIVHVSPHLKTAILDILHDGKINNNRYGNLDPHEQEIIEKIMNVSGLQPKEKTSLSYRLNGIKKFGEMPAETMKKKLDMLIGEIEAGNDNKDVLRLTRKIATDLYLAGHLDRTEISDLKKILPASALAKKEEAKKFQKDSERQKKELEDHNANVRQVYREQAAKEKSLRK